jgi:hypothetical protein
MYWKICTENINIFTCVLKWWHPVTHDDKLLWWLPMISIKMLEMHEDLCLPTWCSRRWPGCEFIMTPDKDELPAEVMANVSFTVHIRKIKAVTNECKMYIITCFICTLYIIHTLPYQKLSCPHIQLSHNNWYQIWDTICWLYLVRAYHNNSILVLYSVM